LDDIQDLCLLLTTDLTEVDVERLAAAVRATEALADQAQVWTGRIVDELRGRTTPPISWTRLSELTGIPRTTLRNRVADYLQAE